jgi:predicted Rossmann fold flavoprotein
MTFPAKFYDVAIVGAGAAGLATAIFTRRANPALSVALLDGARRPGAKILVSGGSRCNVTNAVVTHRDFWGGRASVVRGVLRAFPIGATIAFFREIGIALHEEADGKLFPDTNRARDVLDALLSETAAVGATLLPAGRVLDLERTPEYFRVVTQNGELQASAVVLATGGQSLPKSGSDGAGFTMASRLGHTIVPTTPALVPLTLDPADGFHRDLAGVSHDAEVSIRIDGAIATRLTASMLWTHFGISGPVVLDASRHWLRAQIEERAVMLTVSFCPGQSFEQVEARWNRRARERPRASVHATLSTMVPASLAAALLTRLGVSSGQTLAHFPRDDRRRLVHALVEWVLPVVGTRGYNYAEATAGGVSLDEITPSTMASRVCDGLYLVGEILDVDGRIGGFNFQWAWSGAYVAGRALASRGGR